MAVQNKATLLSYFENGDTPTQAQFADLIDTMFDGKGADSTHADNADLALAANLPGATPWVTEIASLGSTYLGYGPVDLVFAAPYNSFVFIQIKWDRGTGTAGKVHADIKTSAGTVIFRDLVSTTLPINTQSDSFGAFLWSGPGRVTLDGTGELNVLSVHVYALRMSS